jgi:hypothetical protein
MHSTASITCPTSALTKDFSVVEKLVRRPGFRRWIKSRSPALVAVGFWLLGTAAASADDHGNSLSTATAVNVPSTTSGAIQFAGDLDYFRFTITGTRSFTATTKGTTDTFGILLNSAGAMLAFNDNFNGDRNFSISRTLNAGTYYLCVRNYGGQTASAAYQLVLKSVEGAPLMVVKANGYSIASGDTSPSVQDNTDFGKLFYVGQHIDRDFVIQNIGKAPLMLGEGSFNSVHFRFVTQPAKIIAPGASSSFRVRFVPLELGRRASPILADLLISHNAATGVEGSVFRFRVTGQSILLTEDYGDTFASAIDFGDLAAALNDADDWWGDMFVWGASNDPGDLDLFKFTVGAEPVHVKIWCSANKGTDTCGRLYNSLGSLIASDDDSAGGGQFMMEKILPRGVYYLGVTAKPGTMILQQYGVHMKRLY